MKFKVATTSLLFLLLRGFAPAFAENLKRAGMNYTEVLNQTVLSESDYVAHINFFIDPRLNSDSFCVSLYKEWKCNSLQKNYTVKIEVEKIDKVSKRRKIVDVSHVILCGNGEKYCIVHRTTWVKIRKKWYRTLEPCIRLKCKKIK